MSFKKMKMLPKLIIPVVIILVLSLGIFGFRLQTISSEIITNNAKRELATTAGKVGSEVELFLSMPLHETEALARIVNQELAKGDVTREDILTMLEGLANGAPNYVASGGAFEVNAIDGQDANKQNSIGSDANGRFAPYLPVGHEVELLKDYENARYYTRPKQNQKAFISNPISYEINGKETLMTTFSAPIIKNKQFVGVVFLDTALDAVAKQVADVQVYENGWAALINKEGLVITHKNPSWANQNIFDTALVGNKEKVKATLASNQAYMDTYVVGGQSNFAYYFPMEFDGTDETWYLMISAPLGEVLADIDYITFMSFSYSVGAMILIILVLTLLVRSAVKPLGIITKAAEIISSGNLETTVDHRTFSGEVLELTLSLEKMIASMANSIQQAELATQNANEQSLKAEHAMNEANLAKQAAENAKRDGMHQAAHQLSSVVEAISYNSTQLESSISETESYTGEQAMRVSTSAASMEEMNSTVLEVARNSSAASELSVTARNKAMEGAKIVEKSVQSIHKVEEQALRLKNDMSSLDESAKNIDQIMAVISDIADQTNLLALNAAIEAARAGEAGRGFAVVADEVRKLAEKTMNSTSDVSKAISAIQLSTKKSIEQVEESGKAIQEAIGYASESGESLKEIVDLVESVSDQIQAIATAAEEQSAGSNEINEAIGQISNLSAKTADLMQSSSKQVFDMAEQAKILNSLMIEMQNT